MSDIFYLAMTQHYSTALMLTNMTERPVDDLTGKTKNIFYMSKLKAAHYFECVINRRFLFR